MNTAYNLPISSSTATKCTVKTIKDEAVGTIKDVMLDTETGEVAYIVLAVDAGFLNLGSKLLALPWAAFDFHGQQRDVIIVNVDKEKLENAPGFDDDSWPTGPQHEFIHEVNSYYGYDKKSALSE
ncbi:PRC-barrel domain-containing protein [Algoriphagus ratkowskyi]|nr:PRC-barrel domain-containing protein [Algoriphagus ratkowskyi]